MVEPDRRSSTPWRRLPPALRARVEQTLGARVTRSRHISGGERSDSVLRLWLDDGRQLVLKGVAATSSEQMRQCLANEERFYQEIAPALTGWAPELYHGFEFAGWHVLLLEDLGPPHTAPWSMRRVSAASGALARFHAATRGTQLPSWLPQRFHRRLTGHWNQLIEERSLERLAVLAGNREAEASEWLLAHGQRLDWASRWLGLVGGGHALLHLDLHPGNLRVHGNALRLLDWSQVCTGAPELDAAIFALAITFEGGPAPEQALAAYTRQGPLRSNVLTMAVAALAGHVAWLALRRPEYPAVPLRGRRQIRIAMQWAAGRLDLPNPGWLRALEP